jgi:hypothetical protein
VIRRNEIGGVPGGDDGNAQRLVERSEFRGGLGQPHAMTGEDDGTFGRRDHVDHAGAIRREFGRLASVGGRRRIAAQRVSVDHAVLHVERNVDPHRPAPPRRREMHGLFEMKSYVGGIEHGDGIFGDGTHDRDDVDLLRPHLANAAVANEIGALHLT